MWTTILTAVVTITVIALLAGLVLSFASSRLPADRDPLVEKIELQRAIGLRLRP